MTEDRLAEIEATYDSYCDCHCRHPTIDQVEWLIDEIKRLRSTQDEMRTPPKS